MTDHEVFTPAETGEADRLTISSGIDRMARMEAAGHAVKDLVLGRYPELTRTVIMCGPSNNGSDGNCGDLLIRLIVTIQQPNKEF